MKLPTTITVQLGIKYPIIGAPMFLCSNLELVAAISNAGGLGCFPVMNYRSPEELDAALVQLKTLTKKPYGINLIVNSAARSRMEEYFIICRKHKVPVYITSLGNPDWVIKAAHEDGAKVWCDVTTMEYAHKVANLGADALVAVCAGAGGHAGPLSADEFVPLLKKTFTIPVLQEASLTKKVLMLLSNAEQMPHISAHALSLPSNALHQKNTNKPSLMRMQKISL
jgi:nitronate monooxygenase